MSLYKCDLCPKSYRYEKNLKRHIKESHSNKEFWFCAEDNCVSKFVRRSYLSKHLVLKHGFDKLRAHETACKAPRGDLDRDSYYDEISEDESVLDLIEEMYAEQYNEKYISTISDFVVIEYNNNDVVEVGHGEYNDITESDWSDCSDVEIDATVDDAVGDLLGDAMEDAVGDSLVDAMDDAVCDSLGDAVDNTVGNPLGDAVCEAAICDSLGNTAGDAIVGEAVVGDAVDNDLLCDAVDVDNVGDADNVNAASDDEMDVIVIDSEDEMAVVVSELRKVTETIVYTLEKQTLYLGNQIISIKKTVDTQHYSYIE